MCKWLNLDLHWPRFDLIFVFWSNSWWNVVVRIDAGICECERGFTSFPGWARWRNYRKQKNENVRTLIFFYEIPQIRRFFFLLFFQKRSRFPRNPCELCVVTNEVSVSPLVHLLVFWQKYIIFDCIASLPKYFSHNVCFNFMLELLCSTPVY